jgi:hypothetical protein
MRALSPLDLLDAWERGMNEPSATRTLALLAAAWAESLDAVAALSVGERDRRLLALRERTFGSRLASASACPACGERLEWSIDASAFRVPAEAAEGGDGLSLESSGYSIRFRLPTTLDLAAAGSARDVAAARRLLLERCVLDAAREGAPVATADMPVAVVEAIAARMSDADLGSDMTVELTCPSCQHVWSVVFDIESFLWTELSGWAQRVLKDVHTLASAYGWREADILQMGEWRRQFYLTLVGV